MARVVYLDAGHAKSTGGKRSPNGALLEWEFNNAMQYLIKARLEAHGFIVVLTNPNPGTVKDISLSTRASICNNDWSKRGKPSALFVSLHANSAGGSGWSTARGVEVFTSKSCSSNSTKAAGLLCKQIYNDVYSIDKGFRNRGVKKENFTVIYKANMASVLIEFEFYSSQAGVSLLQNKRSLLCESTVKGICAHFGVAYKVGGNNTSNPAPAPNPPANNNDSGDKKYANGTYNSKFKVTATELTVRSARPNSKGDLGPKVGVLKQGAIIEGGYCLNNWMGLIFNGKQAFVSAAYLSQEVAQKPNIPSTGHPWKNGTYKVKARVTTDVLNVRAGRPGQANYNKVIDQLKKGEIIEVDYCLDGWFSSYECDGGSVGFMSGQYLELV